MPQGPRAPQIKTPGFGQQKTISSINGLKSKDSSSHVGRSGITGARGKMVKAGARKAGIKGGLGGGTKRDRRGRFT